MSVRYRKFSRSFKEDAVRSSYQKTNLKELAEDLGIYPCYLTRWRKEYAEFGSGSFSGSGNVRVHPKKEKIFTLEKKIKESELRFEILQKGQMHLFQDNVDIYQFIKNNEKKYSITKMCQVLGVGNGRYLRWKKNAISTKQQQIIILKKEIKTIFLRYKKQIGRNNIAKELKNQGYTISITQVGRYMRKLGLRRIAKRKFKLTTNSKHNFYTAPNILNRNFNVDAPSKVWVSDITYVQANKGFLHLTIIMDLYDRKIVGWSLSPRLSARQTTLPAWEMAVKNRKISHGLIFHSDRGVQYANKIFTAKLDSYQCKRSMSRKGDHCDNAVAESFFSTLKGEFIHVTKLLPQKQLQIEIFDFIENWYNKNRIHSSLGYKTIEEFNKVNQK